MSCYARTEKILAYDNISSAFSTPFHIGSAYTWIARALVACLSGLVGFVRVPAYSRDLWRPPNETLESYDLNP